MSSNEHQSAHHHVADKKAFAGKHQVVVVYP